MPECTKFFDEMREAFGKEVVDDAIRSGRFYAKEAGHELGGLSDWSGSIAVRDMVLNTGVSCGIKR
ncbi:hypothetical protein DU000_03200 [Parvibium lacunae]|uniref:Uncharacterized protein n=2 Tax=Parvibium lacunae TaxID=1888893 RepID=A0A368L916_9BURK|nr:hypothetical protein DU000_03200 [Parvibium lacunae]